MDSYIIHEGDVLVDRTRKQRIEVRHITASHVTFMSGGKEQTATRADFEYVLWQGGFFLLQHGP